MTPAPLDTDTDGQIQINWQAAGDLTLGPDDKLQFTRSLTSGYVGESDNLRRRLSHYRNPGPSGSPR